MIKVYARKEKTEDEVVLKYCQDAQGRAKQDVQVYHDSLCKKRFGRFMWHQTKPRKNSKTVVLNCSKYSLIWV